RVIANRGNFSQERQVAQQKLIVNWGLGLWGIEEDKDLIWTHISKAFPRKVFQIAGFLEPLHFGLKLFLLAQQDGILILEGMVKGFEAQQVEDAVVAEEG